MFFIEFYRQSILIFFIMNCEIQFTKAAIGNVQTNLFVQSKISSSLPHQLLQRQHKLKPPSG